MCNAVNCNLSDSSDNLDLDVHLARLAALITLLFHVWKSQRILVGPGSGHPVCRGGGKFPVTGSGLPLRFPPSGMASSCQTILFSRH